MSKHSTPGPWTKRYRNRCFEIRGPKDEAIALTGCWLNSETAEMEANADLLTAAPQMREALQHVLDGRAGCRDEARAALLAADGEDEK